MSDLPPPPGPVGGAGGQHPPAAPDGSFGPPPGQQYQPPAQPPGQPFGAPTSYMAPMGGGRGHATFGQRLGAYLLDAIIVTLFMVPGYIALVTGEKEIYQCSSDLEETSSGAFLCERPTGGTYGIAFTLFGIGLVAAIAYFGVMEGKGKTVGKRVAGITVVDQTTGQPIGTGRAIGRYFARILSSLPCALGYFWMLWDQNSQTWHDKMTSSIVVQG